MVSTGRSATLTLTAGILALAAAILVQSERPIAQSPPQPPASDRQSSPPLQRPRLIPGAAPAPVLEKYCVSCHNERLRTAGLVIDPATLSTLEENAERRETWEKVVRKLRARTMPPAGAPRPDETVYASLTSSLESALDRADESSPRLGRLPLAHRLSRTEYQNAVRDLLGVDALPKEVSIELLLPPDNISSGFDNIADLLFVSPSAMERYLDAARKISRLAVGDPSMPVLVNIHPLDPEHPQDERVDGLPFGTRGGLAVRSEFPVSGTYTVDVALAGSARGHQIEITVDGARVAMRDFNAPATGGPGGGRGRGAATAPLEFPIQLEAGPHLIGVAFVQRSEARDEATLRPRMRSRGTQPAIASATIRGPYGATAPGDSPSRRRIFVCRPASAAEEAPCARRILSTLARRAYRRPVTETDLGDLMPFYSAGRSEGGFDVGIQKAVERLLVSSQFLFRIERPASNAGSNGLSRISDLELASRLSFFLWSSIPDDELLDAAIAGRLKDPAALERQVRRMLADDRSGSLVTNFAAQWLYLRDIDAKRPDEILFPHFDETLRQAMRRETELFVGSILREDRSAIELLTADYTFLNERLARHYGIPHVKGSYFRRVALPPGSVRGGLLGQGSILTITSYATRTSPVLRGKWVLENLLSSAPPPPPPDIPSLATAGEEPDTTLTMREAMARHRASPSCASCHARMDPIGFAMEHFDAVGAWRETDAGTPIDASGTFPDGTAFEGIAGLKRELVRQEDQFVTTIAERLLMYALGRNLHYYDAPAIRAIVRDAAAGRHTMSALVMGVVRSRPFVMREKS